VLTCEDAPLWSQEQIYKLYVDGMEVLEPTDLTQALMCLFGAYWIFNIQYHARLTNFFTFIEVAFFHLHETSVRPPVIKLLKLLD